MMVIMVVVMVVMCDGDDDGGDHGDCVGSANSDGGDDVLPASRST